MYLALALVLLHLHGHLRQFLHFLLLPRGGCLLALGQEVGEEAVEDGLIVGWLEVVVGGHFVAFGVGLHVGLRGEDLEGVLHLVELQQFLDELQGALPLRAFSHFLHLQVFGVEGGGLRGGCFTFLLEPSWESMVLKTEERICARMLLR